MHEEQDDFDANPMQSDDLEIEENDDYYELDEEEENQFDESNNEDADLDIDIVDKSILSFNSHSKSVFCCSLTNNADLAVSGGEDDRAFVWSTVDGNLKFECTGHEDSVIVAKFSCNSKYLATGDMKGIIKIWNTENGNLLANFEMEELTWLEWHPIVESVFLYGGEEGNCYLTKLSKDSDDFKIMSGNTSALNGLILNDGKRSVVGYRNGDIRLWDLKECSTKFCLKENDPDNQITSLAVRPDNSIIAGGYFNSKLKLVNLNTGKVLFEKKNANEENSIESLVFSNNLPILIIGYLEGEIELLNLETFTKRDSIKLDTGITKLALGTQENDFKLFVSTINGKIKVFDIRDLKELDEFTGHKKDILDFFISKQNNLILSCSDDSTCKLFKI